jgi:hypothetical protein
MFFEVLASAAPSVCTASTSVSLNGKQESKDETQDESSAFRNFDRLPECSGMPVTRPKPCFARRS